MDKASCRQICFGLDLDPLRAHLRAFIGSVSKRAALSDFTERAVMMFWALTTEVSNGSSAVCDRSRRPR